MSRTCTEWAWRLEIKPATLKLVLLNLADRADNDGFRCYPSIDRIAKDTGLNKKTVQQNIKILIERGLIRDTGNRVGKLQRIRILQITPNDPNFGMINDPENGYDNDPENGLKNQSVNQSVNQSLESSYVEQARQCLEYLNQKLGTKYQSTTKSHIENIKARLEAGNTVDDIKLVIDSKAEEWGNDPKMCQYLRPGTMFIPKNFDGYLLKARVEKTAKPSLQKPTNDHQTGGFTL